MDYKQILGSKYDRLSWQQLLHDIFLSKVKFNDKAIAVPISEQIAKEALFLGKIVLSENENIGVYEVELADNVDIKRNRRGIRDMLTADWSNKGYVGAFVLSYRKNESILRFSYVSKVWGFDKDKQYVEKSTAPKRFTYLLGEEYSCRTAMEQFEKLKNSNLTLADITDAFSVEALSNEFFKKYKEHYSEFVAYMCNTPEIYDEFKQVAKTANDADTGKAIRDFVKRQLGRIVFLHFLQKKGWLGVPKDNEWGAGDKQFMQHLFEKASDSQKDNFLSSVLVPLYRDALDADRSNADYLFDTGVEGIGVVRVPYLNGGLFECDALDEHEWKFPKNLFDDLLKMFAEYNFTIDENDPDDAEVGVDPEMLGRIFENLLEDNKDKGAYYTPKEIVQYMCRESLIAYLQTDLDEGDKEKIRTFVTGHNAEVLGVLKDKIDQKLKDVKICDPAIGSGAFPMGLLRELFFCRTALEPEIVCNAAEIKRHIIQNNIYGVDIEAGAVEIARLRFWLSLVVDEESPATLPNLDFKIMQGNSLIESYKGVELRDISIEGSHTGTLIYDDETCNRALIQEKLCRYFSIYDHHERQQLRSVIEKAIKELIIKNNPNIKENLEELDVHANPYFFLWHTWFSDVFDRGGFDIVIGNPPYIKEYVNKNAFDGFRETSPYYMGKMDIWYGFACIGLDMAVKRGGVLCFIAQNNWTTSKGAQILRNKVVKESRIVQMIDFNDYMVFGESASIQTMIMLFINDNSTDDYLIDYRSLKSNAGKHDMFDLLEHKETEKTNYMKPIFNRKLYEGKFITLGEADDILKKIENGKTYMNELEAINGIHPHYDFVDKKINKKHPQTTIGEGIFGLTNEELRGLDLNEKEKNLIKPYYTTNEIKRFYTSPNNKLWLIYTTSEYKNKHSMDAMPALKNHLDKFRDVISSDNKPYGLHRARQIKFFNNKKIVVQRKCCGMPSFSYSDFPCFVSATFYVIQTSRWNMKFLTGVLNSRLIAFWLRYRGKMQGENYQIDKEPLMNIPLPSPDIDQKDIIEQVDTILNKLSKDLSADITREEEIINRLVYNIYNLSSTDIETIENCFC